MMPRIESINHNLSWYKLLAYEKQELYFTKLLNIINAERRSGIDIYPPQKDIFNAFRLTKLKNIKVVILGQDPYYRAGQAHGLAFSVRPGMSLPPSLLNIYRELKNTVPNFIVPRHGCLESWACQGVMLLNIVLTVRSGQARSHINLGWEIFTDKVISIINQHLDKVVFLLWGSYAQKKEVIIDKNRHYVLKAPHPSPFSAHQGFLGCNHFMITNKWLEQNGIKPIDWFPRLLT